MNKNRLRSGFSIEIGKHKALYAMMIPGVIAFFIFSYLPLAGLVVAFKNFNFRGGIFGSPFVGLDNFKFFFHSDRWLTVTKNTIVLNSLFIIVHSFLQVLFAILLNEIASRKFKKISQTVMFLPYFISWIVVSVFVYNMCNFEFGAINSFLSSIGLERINIYNQPGWWPFILTLIDSWKWVGYGTIIYLAIITGINQEYYDAAVIDGANKLDQIKHITIPMLMPTVAILTLLSFGKILNSDFGMFYGIIGDNSALFSTTDIIDTFVYRSLRSLGDIGMASAIGFFQSIVGFILVAGSNYFVKKKMPDWALF